ncbi:MAG: hypothetical protein ABIK09_10615 [Pseudomonadota bacterium]
MDRLEAGWARADLAPETPYPLAGIVTGGERLATWVRDPTRVTCAALRQGERTVALVAMDILVVDPELHGAVEALAGGLGYGGVFLNASHTHSALGGTIDRPLARLFMGRFRPALRALLLERILEVLEAALRDLSPVSGLRAGTAQVPGLTMNRRQAGGPTDDRVLAMELRREDAAPMLIWSASGHPVVVAMSEEAAESADYPGRISAELEDRGFLPLFVLGAVGGLNTLFPEFSIALDDHMDLVARLLTGGLDRALADAGETADPALSWARRDLGLRRAHPPTAGGSLRSGVRAGLSSMVGSIFGTAVAPRETTVPLILLGLGPVRLAGIPADFGVGGTLHIRGAMAGGDLAVVASHSNGFVGYVHMPDDYTWSSAVNPGLFHYENAMGWYGRDVGQRIADAVVDLSGALGPQQTGSH